MRQSPSPQTKQESPDKAQVEGVLSTLQRLSQLHDTPSNQTHTTADVMSSGMVVAIGYARELVESSVDSPSVQVVMSGVEAFLSGAPGMAPTFTFTTAEQGEVTFDGGAEVPLEVQKHQISRRLYELQKRLGQTATLQLPDGGEVDPPSPETPEQMRKRIMEAYIAKQRPLYQEESKLRARKQKGAKTNTRLEELTEAIKRNIEERDRQLQVIFDQESAADADEAAALLADRERRWKELMDQQFPNGPNKPAERSEAEVNAEMDAWVKAAWAQWADRMKPAGRVLLEEATKAEQAKVVDAPSPETTEPYRLRDQTQLMVTVCLRTLKTISRHWDTLFPARKRRIRAGLLQIYEAVPNRRETILAAREVLRVCLDHPAEAEGRGRNRSLSEIRDQLINTLNILPLPEQIQESNITNVQVATIRRSIRDRLRDFGIPEQRLAEIDEQKIRKPTVIEKMAHALRSGQVKPEAPKPKRKVARADQKRRRNRAIRNRKRQRDERDRERREGGKGF